MARLVGVVAALREHCPWTGALTHDSLTTYLLEESYELIEAIETGHSDQISGELGDILLQVVLHARLAQESGQFDVADVARGLSDKMIRRSPHVFHPDGTLQSSFPATIEEIEASWERVKAEERAAEELAIPVVGIAQPDSPFAGIPRSLPALAMAQKSLERAARAGLGAVPPAVHLAEHVETEDELGKVLFGVVQAAQERGLDAERALRLAVLSFQAEN
ncbi:nucleotide pyrophosphohydrolase [Arthrobacter glacialis]|uniref:Nucleotide pyrophosphohydrolase n=2 Tax=Arthrobacter glacialis TaxID=1664 RepID=A0A2S3ZZY9_ARTGL|nr:MazG nucleotide pyrophosphohydrolase domain-containing protein [Arthrobacter glacialis]POH60071.1 nucleotide pyrophosphohydrolase [Arthrobacter glacialis]POH74788.1 nucleotide pyrophosphohydrolase [Arthrobacter glacialis]